MCSNQLSRSRDSDKVSALAMTLEVGSACPSTWALAHTARRFLGLGSVGSHPPPKDWLGLDAPEARPVDLRPSSLSMGRRCRSVKVGARPVPLGSSWAREGRLSQQLLGPDDGPCWARGLWPCSLLSLSPQRTELGLSLLQKLWPPCALNLEPATRRLACAQIDLNR